MPKIKLLHVNVQPVFVAVDGDDVTEIVHPPVTIPADDWPSYSGERFPREVAEWQERLDAEQPQNRSQRRARGRR